ncbi:DNA-binding GntR family transcriptional regulator [Allocatelliglobosispora scoriae]|uniref:DNA-binding GntR family transcriptional regulator n=1 Tax=Allocatelliglobosispora scoriae TaxID=643052 RepID=A0A841BRM2_9ACTN|nr:GntR family transcriptional regulator [Allocatelliglobosispora scoriae]MBB5869563.1 DNA-binding GntR family transcriptional regulator [Allocatelliglobosispora scoriae]
MRSALSDDVYSALKSLIMDHELAPGTRVTIDTVAKKLSVSPTPVREALARLEADGLVTKRPMAGYTTTALLTREEFEHLFEMRLLLECAAAAHAADLRSTADFPDLPTISEGHGYATHADFTAADAAFHDAIAAASGNPLLHDAITRLHSHLHLHRLHSPTDVGGRSQQEHDSIVAAIRAGEAARADIAMRLHLEASRDRHLAKW